MTKNQEERLAKEREAIMKGLENYSDEQLAFAPSFSGYPETEGFNYELYQVEIEINKEFAERLREATHISRLEFKTVLGEWVAYQYEMARLHVKDAHERRTRLCKLARIACARIDEKRVAEGKERIWEWTEDLKIVS